MNHEISVWAEEVVKSGGKMSADTCPGHYELAAQIKTLSDTLNTLAYAANHPERGFMHPEIVDSIKQITGRGWINPANQMPKTGRRVMFILENSMGNQWHCLGFYAEHKTLEADDWENDEATFYDEDSDSHWCPEGWWEDPYSHEYFYPVDGKVIAWKALPNFRAGGE